MCNEHTHIRVVKLYLMRALLNNYPCLEGGHLAFNVRHLDFGWSLFMDTQRGLVESGPSLKAIGWPIEQPLLMDTQVGSGDSGLSCWFLKVYQDGQNSNDHHNIV